MKATVLIENVAPEGLKKEWGLSIFIEYNDKKVLLDTGGSGKFADNARLLSVDLKQVDFGVLSHAHYDHADGMRTFFEENNHAAFYLRQSSAENCYRRLFLFHKYIGIQKGLLEDYQDRIVYVDGDYEAAPGCFLLSHKLESSFAANRMRVRVGGQWRTDVFAHEQSLVFDTPEGLVIFSSCSHTGADNILKEAAMAFPEKQVSAIVGGFHLFERPEEEVKRLASGILESGVKKIYTGHCTGEKAYDILKAELGERLNRLQTGLVMEF